MTSQPKKVALDTININPLTTTWFQWQNLGTKLSLEFTTDSCSKQTAKWGLFTNSKLMCCTQAYF